MAGASPGCGSLVRKNFEEAHFYYRRRSQLYNSRRTKNSHANGPVTSPVSSFKTKVNGTKTGCRKLQVRQPQNVFHHFALRSLFCTTPFYNSWFALRLHAFVNIYIYIFLPGIITYKKMPSCFTAAIWIAHWLPRFLFLWSFRLR